MADEKAVRDAAALVNMASALLKAVDVEETRLDTDRQQVEHGLKRSRAAGSSINNAVVAREQTLVRLREAVAAAAPPTVPELSNAGARIAPARFDRLPARPDEAGADPTEFSNHAEPTPPAVTRSHPAWDTIASGIVLTRDLTERLLGQDEAVSAPDDASTHPEAHPRETHPSREVATDGQAPPS